MIEDVINSLGNITDILIPSEEDINKIIDKVSNNVELDSYDYLVLEKLRFCNYILKSRGDKNDKS